MNIIRLLSIFLLSASAARAAEGKRVITQHPVQFRINANGGLQCFPGTFPPYYPTRTQLMIHLREDPFGFGGFKSNITRVSHHEDVGDHCHKFSDLIGQPNPHRVDLKGTRTLSESYRKEFGTRCGHYLHERLELTVEGRDDIKLTGEILIGLSFVDPSLCKAKAN